MRALDEALRGAEYRERFELVQHWAVRVSDLQACLLRHKPQIVHFSGHGSAAGQIMLEDEQGVSQAVEGRRLEPAVWAVPGAPALRGAERLLHRRPGGGGCRKGSSA